MYGNTQDDLQEDPDLANTPISSRAAYTKYCSLKGVPIMRAYTQLLVCNTPLRITQIY